MPGGGGICREAGQSAGGRLYKDVAIRPTFPVHKTNLRIFKTRFSFRCLPEKRNGSWTPKRKERFTRWTFGAGPGWSSRSSDMVQVRVQSWNSLAEPIPRGAASLGAALGAERTPASLCRGRRPRRPAFAPPTYMHVIARSEATWQSVHSCRGWPPGEADSHASVRTGSE